MRLTLSAVLCAALLASPALAHDRHRGGHDGPPPGDWRHDGLGDPRWDDHAPFPGGWQPQDCADADDRGDDHAGPCNYPGNYPAPYGYGHPGAYPAGYMGYAVPMIMVPVLRKKPCPEVVEEIVEEVPVTARRRIIRPRARIVPDKRVRIVPDKRVPMTPTKRIPY